MSSMPPPPLSDSDDHETDMGATQSTQETQQATQLASQEQQMSMDAHLWGFLIPCSPNLLRIDFSRVRPTYKIGRNANPVFGNDLIFPGMKISECIYLVFVGRWCGVAFYAMLGVRGCQCMYRETDWCCR